MQIINGGEWCCAGYSYRKGTDRGGLGGCVVIDTYLIGYALIALGSVAMFLSMFHCKYRFQAAFRTGEPELIIVFGA